LNYFNNFDRALCKEIPAKFQQIWHGRWTTDNGPSQKLTLRTLSSGELKKALR